MRSPACIRRLITITIVLAGLAAPRAAGQSYRLTEIGTLGGAESWGYGLNSYGQVVGRSHDLDEKPKPFHYQSGELTQVGASPLNLELILLDEEADAYDVSDFDQIVGCGTDEVEIDGETFKVVLAYVFRPVPASDIYAHYYGYGFDIIGPLAGGSNSCAVCIANGSTGATYVVGWSGSTNGTRGMLSFTQSGEFQTALDLGVLGGFDNLSSATGVNSSGRVCGYSYSSAGGYRAFLLTPQDTNADGNPDNWFVAGSSGGNALMANLGTLGGANSWARGINDAGAVVGESDTSSFQTHAFVYQSGAMTDLGTLGGTASSASRINSAGQIVGWSLDENGDRAGFLYENGAMLDLNDLLPSGTALRVIEGRDINSSGQIAGWAISKSSTENKKVAVLLTPCSGADCGGGDSDAGGGGSGGGGTTSSLEPIEPTGTTPDDSGTDSGGSDGDGTSGVIVDGAAAGTCGVGAIGLMPLALLGLLGAKRSARS